MLLIQNGILYTMELDTPIRADLLIREGKIAIIARKISPQKQMHGLDAAGKRVYSGFIDAHSHIGIAQEQTTAQTDLSNEGTNPVTPFIRAIHGINPMSTYQTNGTMPATWMGIADVIREELFRAKHSFEGGDTQKDDRL